MLGTGGAAKGLDSGLRSVPPDIVIELQMRQLNISKHQNTQLGVSCVGMWCFY